MKKANILLLDIEATNLSANFGFTICVGYKWLGKGRVYCPSIVDFPRFKKDVTCDRSLLKAIEKPIKEADIVITWYGKRFDEPYLQTRRLMNGLPPLAFKAHLDLWETAKRYLKFNSNRLDTVSRAIPLRKKERKTAIESHHWVKAAAGHRPSINYVIKHCKADIKVLEEVYLSMLPFIKKHPNVAYIQTLERALDRCPRCGKGGAVKDGFAATAAQIKQVWYCKNCKAHYQTRRPS